MALKSVHARITKSELKRFGFSDRACEIAATANKLVDKKQGSSPEETHLHAMRGMVRDDFGSRVQEARESAVAATQMLVEGAKKSLIDDIRKLVSVRDETERSRRALAVLESLGSVLHTVQDREFHNFGIWSHAGICEALVYDLVGTAMHGVHDFGNMEATVESGSDKRGGYGVAADIAVFPSRQMAKRRIAFFFQGTYTKRAEEKNVAVGVFGIRFGGGPSGVRQPPPRSGPLGFSKGPESLVTMRGLGREGGASSGPVNDVRNRAEHATRDFLSEIEQAAGLLPPSQHPWEELVKLTRRWR